MDPTNDLVIHIAMDNALILKYVKQISKILSDLFLHASDLKLNRHKLRYASILKHCMSKKSWPLHMKIDKTYKTCSKLDFPLKSRYQGLCFDLATLKRRPKKEHFD